MKTKRDPKTGMFINSKKLRKLENLQKAREAARNQKPEQQPIQATQNCVGAKIIDLSYMCNQVVEGCISCKSTHSLADYDSERMVGLASILYIKCGKCSILTPIRTSQSHTYEHEDGKETRIFDINTKCAAGNKIILISISFFNKTPSSLPLEL